MFRSAFFFLLFLPCTLFGQSISLVSWNIKDLGGTKDASEIAAMAQILRDYDLVLIQEVVAKDPMGAQKVAELADELSRTGSQWDYRVSDPTQSSSPQSKERYAFLWKPSRLSLIGRPYLDREIAGFCEREPYIGQFRTRAGESFFVVNFHAIPHNKHPEEEVKYLLNYPTRLGSPAVIVGGDFNLSEDDAVWRPLYAQGYRPALRNTATTLKRACNDAGEYFNHAIDNFYYPRTHFTKIRAQRIDIVGDCERVEAIRALSDHVPVVLEVEWR